MYVKRVEAYCPTCGMRLVTTPDEITGNDNNFTATLKCPFCKAVSNVYITISDKP